VVRYLLLNKKPIEGYLWYIYLGNKKLDTLYRILEMYTLNEPDDLVSLMMIRYFFDRNDIVQSEVMKRKEQIYINVRNETYDEMQKRFKDFLLSFREEK